LGSLCFANDSLLTVPKCQYQFLLLLNYQKTTSSIRVGPRLLTSLFDCFLFISSLNIPFVLSFRFFIITSQQLAFLLILALMLFRWCFCFSFISLLFIDYAFMLSVFLAHSSFSLCRNAVGSFCVVWDSLPYLKFRSNNNTKNYLEKINESS
jgi:hypothetical protein